MKQAFVFAALGCAVVGLMSGSVFAADAPSQGSIAGMLMPKMLQTTRGIPIAGATAARPEQSSSIVLASTGPEPVREPRKKASTTRQASQSPAPAVDAAAPSASFDSIQFEFGSAELSPSSMDTLRNLGNALNQELKDQKGFRIQGHTDAVGSPAYNAELSKRRAEAVKEYLVREMGVAPDRLEAVGKGAAEPMNTKDPYARENRRVVVVNLGA